MLAIAAKVAFSVGSNFGHATLQVVAQPVAGRRI